MKNLESTESQSDTFSLRELTLRQLVFADKVMLNKCDVATQAQVSLVKDAIFQANSQA